VSRHLSPMSRSRSREASCKASLSNLALTVGRAGDAWGRKVYLAGRRSLARGASPRSAWHRRRRRSCNPRRPFLSHRRHRGHRVWAARVESSFTNKSGKSREMRSRLQHCTEARVIAVIFGNSGIVQPRSLKEMRVLVEQVARNTSSSVLLRCAV
jgi:hypothetical protein